MKIKEFDGKGCRCLNGFWILFLFLFVGAGLLGNVSPVLAQENGDLIRAQCIYDHFVAGRGDSVYVALNEEAKRQLSPLMFSDMYCQLEMQFGKLKTTGAWKQKNAQGVELIYRDMQFERYTLRFLLAFDADGCMNTIRLMPAPEPVTAQPVAFDREVMEERDIQVGADGYRLPGTLTLPKAAMAVGRKVPCVILVHGSGPNDRDETVGPNKPFRDLAWGLAKQGIAVIRYDKRTKVYGASFVPEGRKMDMDTETCDDAIAAVAFAKTLPEVATDSIFVLGHSQGGMMAPRIAQRSSDVAGIIILAGLARPLEDAVWEQSTYLASLSGTDEQAQAQLNELKRQVENIKQLGTPEFNDSIPMLFDAPVEYWEFLRHYRPAAVAASLKCPVLVLQGERDYQVTMQDYGMWLSGLLTNRKAQLKSYPELNHILQEGKGKSTPMEYQEARPVPAYVMEDIAGFIRGKDVRW